MAGRGEDNISIGVDIGLTPESKKVVEQMKKMFAAFGHGLQQVAKQGQAGFNKMLPGMTKEAATFGKTLNTSATEGGKGLNRMNAEAGKAGDALRKTGTSAEQAGKGFQKMGFQITFIAWHIRFLGTILQKVSQQFIRTVQDWIKTGAELQDRFFGLQTTAALYGFSAQEAIDVTRDLAQKGLVPLTSSAQAMSNIMLTGAFSVGKAKDFMERYLDVATLVTGGQEEMQRSLEFFTQSVLRGTMILGSDVTARALWNMTNKEAIRLHGRQLSQLDMATRAELIYITIKEKFNDILGLHTVRMSLLGANITRATEAYEYLKYELAMGLWPVVELVSNAIVKAANIVGKLVKGLGSFFPAIIAAVVAITSFAGILLVSAGVLLSWIKIISWATTALSAHAIDLKTASIYHILFKSTVAGSAKAAALFGIALKWAFPIAIALGLAIALLSNHLLKITGASDAATRSFDITGKKLKEITDGVLGSSGLFGDAADEAEDGFDRRAIAHRRSIEDLEEELGRERSKGLWADQMKIKDLEKRLNREKEDWDAYLAERGQQTKREINLFDPYFAALDDVVSATDESLSTLGEMWSNFWDGLSIKAKIAIGALAGLLGLAFVSSLIKKIMGVALGAKLIGWFKTSIFALAKWLKLSGALKVIGGLLAGIASLKFVVIAAFVALIIAAVYAMRHKLNEMFKKVHTWFNETDFIEAGKQIGRWLKTGLLSVLSFLNNLNAQIEKWLNEHDFVKIGRDIGTWLGNAIITTLTLIFYDIPKKLIEVLSSLKQEVEGNNIGKMFLDAIVRSFSNISAILSAVVQFGRSFVEALRLSLNKIDLVEVGHMIGTWLKEGILSILSFFSTLAKNISNWLAETDFQEIGHKIGTWLKEGILSILSFFSTLAKNISNWLAETDFQEIGRKIGTWVKDGILAVLTFFATLQKNVSNWLTETDFQEIGRRIGEWVKNGIMSIFTFWIALNEKIITWLNNADFEEIGEKIGEWVGNAIVGTLKFIFYDLPIAFVETIFGIKDGFEGNGKSIGELIATAMILSLKLSFFDVPKALFEAITGNQKGFEENGRSIGEIIAQTVINALIGIFTSLSSINRLVAGFYLGLYSAFKEAFSRITNNLGSLIGDLASEIGNYLRREISNALSNLTPKINISMPKLSAPSSWFGGATSGLSDLIQRLNPSTWQTGSVKVPGFLGQPRLAVVHGGERIIPAHEVQSQGDSITINIMNPSVRNDGDIMKLANAVSEVLSQKQKWARLGSYPI